MILTILFCISALFPTSVTLSDLYFLEGLWINSKSSVYEEWHIMEHGLRGHSYRMEGNTKVYLETLEIYLDAAEDIILKADVVTNDSPVYFKLISTSNGYVFENPTHDFPKRITYRKTKSGLQAVVEGDESQNSMEFNFKLVEAVSKD